MNRIFNFAAMAAIVGLAFTSCTDEYEYDAAPALNNAKVTLSAEQTSYYFEGAVENQPFTFNVHRSDSTNAATVNLVCDNTEKVSVPASVDFAAGEGTKAVTANGSLQKGDKITISISAADADADIYSQNQYVIITLERDRYAWITCGKAVFVDATMYEDPVQATVDVMRCEGVDEEGNEVKNTYKLANAFSTVYGADGSGDVKFVLDDSGKPVDLITDGGVIGSAYGYDYYYNTTSYAAYCSFERDAESGAYVVSSLLKQGSSLYTGGFFYFFWTEGFPF